MSLILQNLSRMIRFSSNPEPLTSRRLAQFSNNPKHFMSRSLPHFNRESLTSWKLARLFNNKACIWRSQAQTLRLSSCFVSRRILKEKSILLEVLCSDSKTLRLIRFLYHSYEKSMNSKLSSSDAKTFTVVSSLRIPTGKAFMLRSRTQTHKLSDCSSSLRILRRKVSIWNPRHIV